MRKFKIAQIGTGNRGIATLRALAEYPDRVEIVAVCDTDPEKVKQVADQYGVPGFSSVEELLNRASFEVASVTTATPVRQVVAEPLLEAGIDILIDKPFAETLAEARQIVEVAEREGQRVAVGQNYRYLSGYDTARQFLAQDRLGPPRHLTHTVLTHRQDRGWRTDRERYVMAVMSIHWLDGYRWMLDDEPASIYCQTSKSRTVEANGESHTSLIIKFQRGCVVQLTESFGSHRRWSHPPQLDCDHGTLEITNDQLNVYQVDSTKPIEVIPTHRASMDQATYLCLADLLTAVETDTEPPNSGQDNLQSMAMLEAAYLSAAENRIVDWAEMRIPS